DRAPPAQLAGEADERRDLLGAIEDPREHGDDEARREALLGRDSERGAHVSEAIALGSMQRLVGVGARRCDADRDRVEPGRAQPSERGGNGAIRLEVDRARARRPPDQTYRVLDEPRGEERLSLAGPPERPKPSAGRAAAHP